MLRGLRGGRLNLKICIRNWRLRHGQADLNPDEWVWKNVKHDHIAKIVPQRPGHLFEIADRALRVLRAIPATIRSFFADPKLACIRRAHAKA